MKSALLTLCALPLAACTTAYAGDDAPSAPAAGGTCDAAPAQYHIGHDATAEMGAAIMKDTGAQTLRWGPPDSVWTMDYRVERVNVRYDRDMKITEITCG
jgi:hypothetical protein